MQNTILRPILRPFRIGLDLGLIASCLIGRMAISNFVIRTCQHFGTCYKCIQHKYGNKCLPEVTEYKFKMRMNKKKGVRRIICDINPEVDTI